MLERVMIISGESSGELYGSLLAKELFTINPNLKIIGVGGERMLAAGVSLISTISSSFGLIETLATIAKTIKTYKTVINSIKTFKPEILVLIDFPDFNLKIAKIAKKYGIKILYYVSPQIWAWRYNRINLLKKFVDKMALILPFEEDIYKNAHIPYEFVGHPVMDEIKSFLSSKGIYKVEELEERILEIRFQIRKEIGLIIDRPTITIMLGSRRSEINRLLRTIVDFINNVKEKNPDYQFIIPIAPNLDKRVVNRIKSTFNKYNCHILYNESIKSLIASDVAVITSGTSTLQAALLGIPMVVIYKLSPLTYFIGKKLVEVKNISIVNLILDYLGKGNLKVKELLQKEVNTENIYKEIELLLDNSSYRDKIIEGLKIVRKPFFEREASLRVAKIVEELSIKKDV
jgi:lipid-A-disaccharide synthase